MMKRDLLFPVCAAMALSLATTTNAQAIKYDEMCEASGAVALDAERFLVVSDDMDEALIYRRGEPKPVGRVPLGKVSDLEEATWIGDKIFVTTGHSVAKGPPPDDKAKRRKLLALNVGTDGALTLTGKAYVNLRADVQALVTGVLPSQPVDEGASSLANFEGLSAPEDGAFLLVGLRAPVTESGMAVVVRIDRPFMLVSLPQPDGVSSNEGRVFELNLGGRGVRGMARRPDGEGYLIIGGSELDGSEPPSALFTWVPGSDPVPLDAPGLDAINPEAAFYWPDGTLTILGDNGGMPQPDGKTPCSDDADDAATTGPRWFPALDFPA